MLSDLDSGLKQTCNNYYWMVHVCIWPLSNWMPLVLGSSKYYNCLGNLTMGMQGFQ